MTSLILFFQINCFCNNLFLNFFLLNFYIIFYYTRTIIWIYLYKINTILLIYSKVFIITLWFNILIDKYNSSHKIVFLNFRSLIIVNLLIRSNFIFLMKYGLQTLRNYLNTILWWIRFLYYYNYLFYLL